MYVVSGCPRSGTSLMMDILREVFGEDRILGKKHIEEGSEDKYKEQQENETDEQYSARMYLIEKFSNNEEKEKRKKKKERVKNMNPNGFWEMLYTVQGCYFRFQDSEQLEKLLIEEKKSICKIVSQGLINSDPQYIDKIIYMIRHPRSVAKSQENLERQFPFSKGSEPKSNGETIKVHSPEMYINVTAQASMWLKKYSNVEIMFVHFDELISNPKKVLTEVQDFLGEGDFKKAISRIDPKLKRSYPQEIDNPFWKDAEFIYDHFLEQDYEGIIKYMENLSLAIHKKNKKIYCCRLGRTVIEDECLICMSSEQTRKNYKVGLEKRGIDWKSEPCIYECGQKERGNITVKESILNNFWISDGEGDSKDDFKISFSDLDKMLNFKP